MSDADFEKVRAAQAERNAAGKKGSRFDDSSQRTNNTKQSLTDNADTDLYGNGSNSDKFAGYNTSIAADGDEDGMDVDGDAGDDGRLIGQYTATTEQMNEWAQGETAEDDILNSREKQAQIASRETDYQKKRFDRNRLDDGTEQKSYKQVMQARELEREEERVKKMIADKEKEAIANGEDMDGVEHQATLKEGTPPTNGEVKAIDEPKPRARKRRWDVRASSLPLTARLPLMAMLRRVRPQLSALDGT